MNNTTSSSSPPSWTMTPMKETTALKSPSIMRSVPLGGRSGRAFYVVTRLELLPHQKRPLRTVYHTGHNMADINELETPALIVDETRLARNLDRGAEYARSHNILLRPHIKTH